MGTTNTDVIKIWEQLALCYSDRRYLHRGTASYNKTYIYFHLRLLVPAALVVSGYMYRIVVLNSHLNSPHQENMSMKSISPHIPLLYSKTGVNKGIPIFLPRRF